jgi:hypothetical protein
MEQTATGLIVIGWKLTLALVAGISEMERRSIVLPGG